MTYLIDAGVLITANALYYPIDRVPEFWGWLLHHAEAGRVKVPLEIYEEIKDGPTEHERDLLYDWVTDEDIKCHLILDEDVDPSLVSRVVMDGYAQDLTDSEIEQIGRDPFLVAYAMRDLRGRTVVTTEVSKPSKQRQNKKLPDVCTSFGVRWLDTFAFVRELNFSTSWRR
ncbi:DUF4411 family protein [Lysobacter sp. yr284]|uniref:DUF4411 family protein n=1 Tax=Lysobacter sp. yr284 TaxID=1761791 RepID=UPI000B8213F3|nr:DUF4411 family protein [Lysobacter sp. yr284]